MDIKFSLQIDLEKLKRESSITCTMIADQEHPYFDPVCPEAFEQLASLLNEAAHQERVIRILSSLVNKSHATFSDEMSMILSRSATNSAESPAAQKAINAVAEIIKRKI